MGSQLLISLCQTNSTIGNFELNFSNICIFIEKSIKETSENKNSHLIVFPESSLTGYPLHDLLELNFFFKNQTTYLKKIQKKLNSKTHVLLGALLPNPQSPGRPFINAAVFISSKKIQIIGKSLLPTEDVFNEDRWFESFSFSNNIISINKIKILVTVCEDIWGWKENFLSQRYSKNPLEKLNKKVQGVINLSASPFTHLKEKQRNLVVKKTAQFFKAPVFYCNRWGAEDELIFDGQSLVSDKNGTIIFKMKFGQDDRQHFLFSTKSNTQIFNNSNILKSKTDSKHTLLRKALVLGIQEFCKKNNFEKVHLGLSGGIDSALVACLAVEALGSKNVNLLALPSLYSSPTSFNLAQSLSKNLGSSLQKISIDPIYELAKKTLDSEFQIPEFGLVHENLQSRIRALVLMAYSNTNKSLLLSTSNKSELATGYGTLYGDMCGGLMPIGDLYKTQVFELAENYLKSFGWITQEMIDRPPTAELKPNQLDSDSLPPYKNLDQALFQIIELNKKPKNLKMYQFVIQALFRSEFKRWQAPPILKVSKRSFGKGRHWPIGHSIS